MIRWGTCCTVVRQQVLAVPLINNSTMPNSQCIILPLVCKRVTLPVCLHPSQPGPELQHAPATLRNPRGLRRLIRGTSKDSPGDAAAAMSAVGAVRPPHWICPCPHSMAEP